MQETATVQLADDDCDSVVCFCLFFQLTEAHVATVGKRQIYTACQMQVDQVSEKKPSARGVQRINSLTLFIYF